MNAPIKTVTVPLAAIAQLFDMGNYVTSDAKVQAIDLARNMIRHTLFELQMLGDCIGADRTISDEDLRSHCWRLSAQLEAGLGIVNSMLDYPRAPTSEPEAAE